MVQNHKLESPQVRRPAIVKLIIGALMAGGIVIFIFYRFRSASTPPKPLAVAAPQVTTVTALGRLEPKGEVIKLTAPTSNQGTRVEQLLVKEGDVVQAGQAIAVMENRDRLLASMREAEKKVTVAKAQLAQVTAGAKQGELTARGAEINRLQAELTGNVRTQQAEILSSCWSNVA
jgi:HlyD family secretion protein